MTEPRDFLRQIDDIAAKHGSFRPEAYLFVLEAVEKRMLDQGQRRHISGDDLLDSIKQLGRQRYGIMATEVFAAWGVHTTLDFGRCVFHLVEGGLLSKRDDDSLRDFIDRYEFRQVFEEDFFLGQA